MIELRNHEPLRVVFLAPLLALVVLHLTQLQLESSTERQDGGARVSLVDPLLDLKQPEKYYYYYAMVRCIKLSKYKALIGL